MSLAFWRLLAPTLCHRAMQVSRALCVAVIAVAAQAAAARTMDLTTAVATVHVAGTVSQATVTLPYHWDRAQATRGGEGVFEIRFSVDELPREPQGAYFPRIGNSYRVWLNGYLLQQAGDPERANDQDHAKAPTYVPVPAGLLEIDNVLRIELRADDGRRGGLSAIRFGPASQVLAEYERARLLRVDVSLAITVFSLLVGMIALVLWFTQQDASAAGAGRRDNIYLFAGLAEISWALRVGDVAIESPPLPWPLWGVVATGAFAGWICCTALFCHNLAGWQHTRSMRWLNAGMATMFVAALTASAVSLTSIQPVFLTAWLGFANLFFVMYALFYLGATLRKPDTARVLVALAGLLNLVMGIRDWLAVRINGNYADSTWIRYSSVLFGIALGYIVVSRFREASAQARDLRENLARRVQEKEQQLQQSYEQVEQLARSQERASERARILRDMHDGVGSHISSAIRQLQSGKASPDAVLQTLRDSLDQLKLSIDSMNLPAGDVTALLANLRYRLEPRLGVSDIELKWDVDLIEPVASLDTHHMRQLQFMLFESLSNVLQHAQARTLTVEARAQEGGAVLRIVDDGRGFDSSRPFSRGLLSMQERARAIGAVLAISSAPGRTVVEIRLS
ncbi:MAG: histidine kinase [Ramlibacter sp.]|nr:histidine kinase [Ramlibacter sp.]